MKSNSPVSLTIFYIIVSAILFIDSILILISLFRKGIIKKQVLSQESDLGFDIDIILKS